MQMGSAASRNGAEVDCEVPGTGHPQALDPAGASTKFVGALLGAWMVATDQLLSAAKRNTSSCRFARCTGRHQNSDSLAKFLADLQSTRHCLPHPTVTAGLPITFVWVGSQNSREGGALGGPGQPGVNFMRRRQTQELTPHEWALPKAGNLTAQ
eukprot:1151031-Pelagomonas_calceolata.AAC.11